MSFLYISLLKDLHTCLVLIYRSGNTSLGPLLVDVVSRFGRIDSQMKSHSRKQSSIACSPTSYNKRGDSLSQSNWSTLLKPDSNFSEQAMLSNETAQMKLSMSSSPRSILSWNTLLEHLLSLPKKCKRCSWTHGERIAGSMYFWPSDITPA